MNLEQLVVDVTRKLRRCDCMAQEPLDWLPRIPDERQGEIVALRDHYSLNHDSLAVLATYLVWSQQRTAANEFGLGVEDPTRFAGLCNLFGFHERVLSLPDLSQRQRGDPDHTRAQLQIARAHRGCGRYADALRVYQHLYDQDHFRPGDAGYLILQMAKTAHNHLWRTGLFAFLTEEAQAILATMRDEDATAARHYAITLDSFAFLWFELREVNGATPELLASAYERGNSAWREAIDIVDATSSANSSLRMRLRRAYANSFLAPERERDEWLLEFRTYLAELERDQGEVRGLAVRFGQYAHLLMQARRWERVDEYLSQAVHCAEQVSDWRTFAVNQLRYMEYYSSSGGDNTPELVEGAATSALEALGRLKQTHPEVEVRIHLESSRINRRHGRYDKSRRSLEAAVELVRRLEDRIANDDLIETPAWFFPGDPARQHRPEHLLKLDLKNPARLSDARLLDYRLLSQLHNQLVTELHQTADVGHRQESTQLQFQFLVDYETGRRHWMINLIQGWKDQVLGVLRDEQLGARLRDSFLALEKRLRERAFDLDASGLVEFTSVKKLAQEIAEDSALRSFDARLEITWCQDVGSDHDDFLLECNPGILNFTLFHLIENAAKVHRNRSDDGPRRIWISTGWHAEANGSHVGIIRVMDDAGQYPRLQKALDTMGPGTGRLGLFYGNVFFGKYGGTLRAYQDTDGRTCIFTQLSEGTQVQAP